MYKKLKVIYLQLFYQTNNQYNLSMENATLALKSVLCYDVSEKIQDFINKQRLMDIHAEYFEKLSRFIENKIDIIEMEMEENTLSEYGIRDLSKDQEQWEWSIILDDIYYNSGNIVNSQYRPDSMIM